MFPGGVLDVKNNLTLTRVVFELKKEQQKRKELRDLTLTRVVFELDNMMFLAV